MGKPTTEAQSTPSQEGLREFLRKSYNFMSKSFATRRLLGILITCVMITSCSGGTSSNTPNGGGGNNSQNQNADSGGTSSNTSNGGGGDNSQNQNAERAELEWQQYRSDCQGSSTPIPRRTFSDGSRGRCEFGPRRRADGSSIPVAFRDR
ncbi:hypothetical protein [Nodularia spumigena]|uniref:hypothetical protein n=1 Tax=Nodularia spumigena TaxID=70799 RepID=UPI002B2001DC|nr:hypothetical protein [Nodularia spumigena]MEA5556289.1 hypothetical protein [Nodularia spumigena CH309]